MSAPHFHPLPIAAVTPNTDQAVCVDFAVPEDLRDRYRFEAGQYLTLRAEVDGEVVSRSYSICVPPSSGKLQVAIKRVEGGVFSNFANDTLRAGMTLEVMPPEGNFRVPASGPQAASYLFIAAGSGITPMLAMMQELLEAEPASRVTLLYGNQRTATIMFRQELAFLKNRFLERFNWINILSREAQDSPVLNGRIDNRKGAELNGRLLQLTSFSHFFLCGPESMISEVSRGLRGLGVSEERIAYELFGSSAEDAATRVARHHARSEAMGGKVCSVKIVSDGRASEVEIAADGENLLDAGINLGLDLPYACKGGVCSTCKALLVEGEVEMDIQRGLTEAEIAAGMILTCQSHPVSDRVHVDFDQRWSGG